MFVMLLGANLVTAQIEPTPMMLQQEVIEEMPTITLDESQKMHNEDVNKNEKKTKLTSKSSATTTNFLLKNGGGPLAGVYSIGGGSADFPSLTAAASYLANFGVAAPVFFELNDSYDGSLETFPINFASVASGQAPSATNPLTIRPALGVTNRIIEGNNRIFDFTGMGHITIDGRPGGIGTTSQLRITNTATFGTTIRFRNEASHNTITYCTISGSGDNVILIGTTTGANGNDQITITHNIIRGGATMPGSLIINEGTTTNADTFNSGINISHNEFINFRSYGILFSHSLNML